MQQLHNLKNITCKKSWGFFDPENKLHVEQVTKKDFIYNHDGDLGLATLEVEETANKSKFYFLIIKNFKIIFSHEPREARIFYNIPSLDKCNDFITGKYVPRTFAAILKEAEIKINLLYDFQKQSDVKAVIIHIAQSWTAPLLDSFVFLSIDSSFAGGKTTLLEILAILKRHGFQGGDISPAALPRLTDDFDLNISLDELDQRISHGEDDSVALLRKGQRRGNPYVRCEGKNFVPAAYEVCGVHDYTIRSETEDAFASRSLKIHAARSSNSKLPILNAHKKTFLKPLADELFFACIRDLLSISEKAKKIRGQIYD